MVDNRPPRTTEEFLDLLRASYTDYQLERIDRSFFLLDPAPQKRRLQAIMGLSVERQRLLDEHGRQPGRPDLPQGFQASAFMERVIQYLIEGDFNDVRAYADMYLFEGEDKEWTQRYIDIYAKFRAIALAAITEPEDMQ